MKRVMIKEWVTLLMAFAVCFVALPTGAKAASATETTTIKGGIGIKTDDQPKECYDLSGKAGATMDFVIPVKNDSTDRLVNLTCKLVVADQHDGTFPITIGEGVTEIGAKAAKKWDATNKTAVAWDGAALEAGEIAYFSFQPALLSTAAGGKRTLAFAIGYKVDGSDEDMYSSVNIPFTIQSPSQPTGTPTATPSGGGTGDVIIADEGGSSGGGGGSSYKSKPKVIVQSYSFDTDRVYAGESCKLSVRLRNTSSREAVKNLQFNFTNEAGVVVPVSGGSNSVFIGELKKESSVTLVIGLSVAPDAESKSQTLHLEITYEGTKNKQEFTEKSSITVPVMQRARVRCDTPVIYDEAWAGQSVNMSVQMFNLGKSTLYNCMVEVEGEGLTLEETYFGGNISSGGTLRADLSLKTAVAGEVEGTVRITYEDAYGEQSEQRLPFTLTVNEEGAEGSMPFVTGGNADMEAMAQGEGETGGGIPWYLWAVIGAIILTVVSLIVVKLRQRRALELEDD